MGVLDARATLGQFSANLKKVKNRKQSEKPFLFQKKFSLYFGELNFLAPRLKVFSYSSKNFFSSISGVNLQSLEIEKNIIFKKKKFFLYFEKWNSLAPSLKNTYIYSKKALLIFQEGTCKAKKTKKIHSEEISFPKKVFFTFWDDCWSSHKMKIL